MVKPTKAEIIKLMAELKAKGFTNEDLGSSLILDKSSQTLWAWSSPKNKRIPCKSDYEALRRLLATK